MRKFLYIIFGAIMCSSCSTVKNSVAVLDKDKTVQDIISYDLAEVYNVDEVGTVYDYPSKAIFVSCGTTSTTYILTINRTNYRVPKEIFFRYPKGSKIDKNTFNQIKKFN